MQTFYVILSLSILTSSLSSCVEFKSLSVPQEQLIRLDTSNMHLLEGVYDNVTLNGWGPRLVIDHPAYAPNFGFSDQFFELTVLDESRLNITLLRDGIAVAEKQLHGEFRDGCFYLDAPLECDLGFVVIWGVRREAARICLDQDLHIHHSTSDDYLMFFIVVPDVPKRGPRSHNDIAERIRPKVMR